MDIRKRVRKVHSICRHVLVQIFSLYNHTAVHESILLTHLFLTISDYTTGVLLDANENAIGPSLPSLTTTSSETNTPSEEPYITGLNRYPDPYQRPLKQLICDVRNSQSDPIGTLTPDNLFCGVGSDEAIDSVMRIFCKPGRDKIMICTPTYGMYKVSAAINEVGIIDVPLIEKSWQMDVDKVYYHFEFNLT